jgi:F0F1-type ATP synthase membrane subunit c/vacuolar-type H+-ATPase subunit K
MNKEVRMVPFSFIIAGLALIILGLGIFLAIKQGLNDILVHPGGRGEYFLLFMLGVVLMIIWLVVQLYHLNGG